MSYRTRAHSPGSSFARSLAAAFALIVSGSHSANAHLPADTVFAGTLFAGTPNPGAANLFDSSTTALDLAPLTLGSPIQAIAVAQHGVHPRLWLATGSNGSELILFDVATNLGLLRATAPHPISELVCDGTRLLAASATGALSALDASSGMPVSTLETRLAICALHLAGGMLYVGTSDGQIWRASDPAAPSLTLFANVASPLNSLTNRGSWLLAASDHFVFIVDLATGFEMYGYNVPNDAQSIVVDGNSVLVGGSDGTLFRVDPETANVLEADLLLDETSTPIAIRTLAVANPTPFALLDANSQVLSLTHPQPIALHLEVSDSIGHLPFLIAGSASGTSPGFTLSGVHVPLVIDPYFWFTLAGNPLVTPAIGTFSNANSPVIYSSEATFSLPVGIDPALAGITLDHAFLVLDLSLGRIAAASNARSIFLLP